MSAIATGITWIDDRLNPIVVKELRQAVAGKFVASVMLLFLVIQLIVIGFGLMIYADEGGSRYVGDSTFMSLLGFLLGVSLLFIPAYAALRLAAERSDTNQDLLFITTIRPRSIVWGKFSSAMTVAVLIYATCLPFMSLTFLLGGIDLPTILLLIAFTFVVVAGCTMLAIFLSCIPTTRIVKALLFVVGLGALGTIYMMTIFFCGGVAFGEISGLFELWSIVGTTTLFIVVSGGLLWTLSVAMVSPPSSNRAPLVRLYTVAATVVTGGFMLWLCGETGDDDPLLVWLYLLGFFWCFALLPAICERESWGSRIRRQIPRNLLLRRLAFFLYSGAPGGIVFTVAMLAAVIGFVHLASTYGLVPSVSRDLSWSVEAMTLFALYCVAYALLGLFVRRFAFGGWVAPVNTYAISVILMALGTILPFIVLIVVNPRPLYDLDSEWLVTMPFVAFYEPPPGSAWWLASGGAILGVLLNIGWFVRSASGFQPLAIGETVELRKIEPTAENLTRPAIDEAKVAQEAAAIAAADPTASVASPNADAAPAHPGAGEASGPNADKPADA